MLYICWCWDWPVNQTPTHWHTTHRHCRKGLHFHSFYSFICVSDLFLMSSRAPLLYGSALHFIHAAYISRYMWRLSVPGWVKLWPISKSKMETWKRLHPFCRNCRWVLARDLLMCFVFVLLRPVQTKCQYSLCEYFWCSFSVNLSSNICI